MIFRRIKAHVEKENWFAVGIDFFIVVVGVFIGLQSQAWVEARRNFVSEEAILREIHQSLSDHHETYRAHLERYDNVETAMEELLIDLEKRNPYSEDLDRKFGLFYGFDDVVLNQAAYESLKSQGLDLIASKPLRLEIINYFEKTSQRALVSSNEQEPDFVLNVFRPYVLPRFRNIRFRYSATPLDYDALLDDPVFTNLIDYRLQTVRQNHIPKFENANQAAVALSEHIAQELDDRFGGSDV